MIEPVIDCKKINVFFKGKQNIGRKKKQETRCCLCQPSTSLFLIFTLLIISLMMFWAKRLDSVESGCWNVEILEEKEAMAEVNGIPFCKEMSWSVSWELVCILEGERCGIFTAAPGTKGWKRMNCLGFHDNI